MKQKKATVTEQTIRSATYLAQRRCDSVVKMAQAIKEDTRKEAREQASLCKACFYSEGRLGGAAMTTRPCALCDTEEMYGSTATDPVCLACARQHELCKQCGGDLHLRSQRASETE